MQKNLFLAPASKDGNAYDHLQKTVVEGISNEALGSQVDDSIIRVWGVTSGLKTAWENAKAGDWLLFYTGNGRYEYAAKVIGKSQDAEIGSTIRSEILDVTDRERLDGKEWTYLFYLDSPIRIDLSGSFLSDILGYKQAYRSRFQRVPQRRLDDLEDKFGNIEGLIAESKR